MTLTELKYIIAVAREKHFGRAADACYVSQPTLSVAVKKLEEELQVQLFERQSGEVMLTPQGRVLIAQAQRVLDEAKQLKQLAKYGVDPKKGPIRLGTIYTIAPYILPSLIRKTKQHLADAPLFLHETFTAVLLEMLRQGELDCAILAYPFSMAGLEAIDLYDESYVVAVPHDHEWAKRDSIEPQELSGQNMLLLGTGHCFRDHVLQICPELNRQQPIDEDGQDTPRNFEGSSLETIRQMVAGGIGITVLPRTSVVDINKRDGMVSYIPFTNPQPSRRITLVWRKGFPRKEVLESLAQVIQSCDLPEVHWIKSAQN